MNCARCNAPIPPGTELMSGLGMVCGPCNARAENAAFDNAHNQSVGQPVAAGPEAIALRVFGAVITVVVIVTIKVLVRLAFSH
jgi:hypothetical protein